MKENLEKLRIEKFSVIFVIWDGQIQLEERIEPKDKYFGYTIVPGGSCEKGETYVSALKREMNEEYGATPTKFEQIGVIRNEDKDTVNFRHIFLVTEWEGKLNNVEMRNKHLRTSLKMAKQLCKHPISQQVLTLVEDHLSRQD
ncbi:MAG: NUDIX hydrolase [bacterium]|nr:MAG: NUDIX hydrolase [bacterium]